MFSLCTGTDGGNYKGEHAAPLGLGDAPLTRFSVELSFFTPLRLSLTPRAARNETLALYLMRSGSIHCASPVIVSGSLNTEPSRVAK